MSKGKRIICIALTFLIVLSVITTGSFALADSNNALFSTADEATPDEATPDEATPDEATPNETTPNGTTSEENTSFEISTSETSFVPGDPSAPSTVENTTPSPTLPHIIHVNRITLSFTKLSMYVGSTRTLRATVFPKNATNKGIVWKSNNSRVAAVSQTGRVNAKSKGTANITATARDGSKKSGKCVITVRQYSQKLTVSASSIKKTYGCKAFTVKGKSNRNTKITYRSSNKRVALVSSRGKVTVRGIGQTKITVKAAGTVKYRSASKTVKITVVPKRVNKFTIRAKKLSSHSVKISWKRDKSVTSYVIQMSRTRNYKHKTSVKCGSDKKSAVIRNLHKGKTYYVRIAAYKNVAGKRYYSNWTKLKVRL